SCVNYGDGASPEFAKSAQIRRMPPLTLPPLSVHACVRLPGASLMRQGPLPLPARRERAGVRGIAGEIRLVKHVALSYEDSYSMPMRLPPLRRPGLHPYTGLVC